MTREPTTGRDPIADFRYFACFSHGKVNAEKETNDLAEAKQFIADRLRDCSNPTHAIIRDNLEDKTIFEETNPNE